MKKILIATTNPGKLAEIKEFLSDLPFKFLSLSDLKIMQKADENFPTFAENSRHKAKFYSSLSGISAIADDGGLEIDYLSGAPGVKSRRWVNGSEDTSDQELVDFTLFKLKGVPWEERTAKLTTVISLAFPSGEVYSASSSVKGLIAETPYGKTTPGFPYRSFLFLPEISKFYHSSEMTLEETEKYNHRKKALEKLKKTIKKI